jgi:hypothetical protein
MKRYYWNGISKDERIKSISEITTIIDKYAAIINFQRFSDISLSLVIEIEENKLNDLYKRLEEVMFIKGLDIAMSDSTTECIILFNITFTKGTGDMKYEVPNIPG